MRIVIVGAIMTTLVLAACSGEDVGLDSIVHDGSDATIATMPPAATPIATAILEETPAPTATPVAIEETPSPADTPKPPKTIASIGSGDCVELRAEPGPYADVVDCVPKWAAIGAAPEGVWVSAPDWSERPDTFWRPLKRDGRTVWVDNRSLEQYSISSPSSNFLKLPAPPIELPDDIALVGFATIYGYEHAGYAIPIISTELIRIRNGPDGEPVRETLFTPPEGTDLGWEYIHGSIATPDLSRIVLARDKALYESVDGGVSWSYLDDLERVYFMDLEFAAGDNDGDPEQVLSIAWPPKYSEGGETVLTLHPSGEREVVLGPENVHESRLGQRIRFSSFADLPYTIDIPYLDHRSYDRFRIHARISEGELEGQILGSGWFPQLALTRGGATENEVDWDSYLRLDGATPLGSWPSIYDQEENQQHALVLPGVWNFEEEFWPFVGLQYGPFLHVSGPGHCLPLRAEPTISSEDLACIANNVLLTDLDEETEVDGMTWRRVRTPAGLDGWADGRYLE